MNLSSQIPKYQEKCPPGGYRIVAQQLICADLCRQLLQLLWGSNDCYCPYTVIVSRMCPGMRQSPKFWLLLLDSRDDRKEGREWSLGQGKLTILQKTSWREGIMAQSFLSVTGFPLHISSHTVFLCVPVHVCLCYHIHVHLCHHLCALGSKAFPFP